MLPKLKKLIKDPYYVVGKKMLKYCPKLMSDRYYLKVMWKQWMGYELDLEHPKTFNEKLQWLKLYDRKPEYTMMVDKYRVKQWVAERIGEQYVIPTLAVYNSVDEIDLDKLPNQFVLKCNHDSGSVVICRDKATFDLEAAKKKLNAGLKRNFYWLAREWPYKNVKRCVIAERFLADEQLLENDKAVPNDYKFFCFDGEPKIFQSCVDRDANEGAVLTFYDIEGKELEMKDKYHNRVLEGEVSIPRRLDAMLRISRNLAKNITFLRVDFYEIAGQVYCGELTFYENGGFCEFAPEKYNRVLGDWIKLPTDKNN